LNRLTYDQYRAIRFRPEEALWHGEALFEIQLFHPGYEYRDPVTIHLVEGDRIRTLDFETQRFRYEGEAAPLRNEAPSNVGHAGFRVHYPLNSAANKDEVVVFLGDSYFRLLGPGHVHGLSSRGVAVDTGLPSGEEFPAFREFWLVRPEPMARSLTFFALLDSPSLTGAFRFDLHPGGGGGANEDAGPSMSTGGPGWVASEGTVLEVDARFYARRDVAKLGVAPLTSMFLFDGNTAARFDDFRPRVHDSHGLLALTSAGEWLWRPLSNGPSLRTSSLRDRSPRGFGLVQRERDFDSYLDLEARYDRRPSEWVDIVEGHWGSGGVDLVEIPSESEFNDNVVAFWAGDAPFREGDVRHYRYRLVTFDRRLPLQTLAQVEQTLIGWDALPGEVNPPPRNRRRFVVDFRGGVPPFEGDGAVAEAVLSVSAGRISGTRVQRLPDDGGWRVTFALQPEEAAPADLRLYLERAGQRLTETWTYVWYPEQSG
jgi:glucans biosynthesis protein